MEDLVIVQSKTINHEAVPVILKVFKPLTGEDENRTITRSVIFENFQSTIPLSWAKTLVKEGKGEFAIVDAKGEVSTRTKKTIEVAKEASQGFKCRICGSEAKSKAGLSAHMRFNHPDSLGKEPKTETIKE